MMPPKPKRVRQPVKAAQQIALAPAARRHATALQPRRRVDFMLVPGTQLPGMLAPTPSLKAHGSGLELVAGLKSIARRALRAVVCAGT